jgi:hypothetical protein
MCIIARIPAGTQLPEENLENMWQANPHGGGIGYIDGDKVAVKKAMELKEFKQLYKEVSAKHGDRDMLVHMRIATHGSVCLDNTHPFEVNKNTVMAHNGMMPDFFEPPKKSDMSDTRFFIETMMKRIDITSLDDVYFTRMLEQLINSDGYPNKLVFISSDKRLKFDSYIIGEKLGEYDKNGIWYSNKSYQAKRLWKTPARSWSTPHNDYTIVNSSDQCEIPGIHVDDEEDMIGTEHGHDEWSELGLTTIEQVEKYAFAVPTGNGESFECVECGSLVYGDYRECLPECKSANQFFEDLLDAEETGEWLGEPDYIVVVEDEDDDVTKAEARELERSLKIYKEAEQPKLFGNKS